MRFKMQIFIVISIPLMILSQSTMINAENEESNETEQTSYYQEFGNCSNNKYYPFDTSDHVGFIQWEKKLTEGYGSILLSYQDTFYYGYKNRILCFNIQGEMKWEKNISGYLRGNGVVDTNGNFYVSASDNTIIKIDRQGNIISTIQLSSVITEPLCIWDSTIYYIDDNEINALDLDGSYRWNYSVAEDFDYPPGIDEDGILYLHYSGGNSDEEIMAIYPNGTLKWNFSMQRYGEDAEYRLWSPFVVDNIHDRIFISGDDDIIFCFDLEGELLWKYHHESTIDTDYIVPCVDPEGNVFASVRSGLLFLDADGNLMKNIDHPTAFSSQIYISENGDIFAENYLNSTIVKMNKQGEWVWESEKIQGIRDFIVTPYQTIIVATSYADLKSIFSLGYAVPREPVNITINGGRSKSVYTWHQVDHIDLFWASPIYDGGYEVEEYLIYLSVRKGPFELIGRSASCNYSYRSLNGNLPRGIYTFKVSGVNILGEGKGSVNGTFDNRDEPYPPYNLSVRYWDGRIYLNWDPPVSDGGWEIYEYLIYRKSDDYGFRKINSTNGSVTEFIDENVVLDEKYQYYVVTSGRIIWSEPSEEVEISTVVTDKFEHTFSVLAVLILFLLFALFTYVLHVKTK